MILCVVRVLFCSVFVVEEWILLDSVFRVELSGVFESLKIVMLLGNVLLLLKMLFRVFVMFCWFGVRLLLLLSMVVRFSIMLVLV